MRGKVFIILMSWMTFQLITMQMNGVGSRGDKALHDLCFLFETHGTITIYCKKKVSSGAVRSLELT